MFSKSNQGLPYALRYFTIIRGQTWREKLQHVRSTGEDHGGFGIDAASVNAIEGERVNVRIGVSHSHLHLVTRHQLRRRKRRQQASEEAAAYFDLVDVIRLKTLEDDVKGHV